MSETIKFHFDVDGDNFSSAGEASVVVKKKLRQLGFPPDVIRKVSIAMYEGEINMVIPADGGTADVEVLDDEIVTPEDTVNGIEAVTMEQVCEAAKKLSIDTIYMLKAQEGEESENEN